MKNSTIPQPFQFLMIAMHAKIVGDWITVQAALSQAHYLMLMDITMPHDTAVFEMTSPDGLLTYNFSMVVTVNAPSEVME